jgi:[ribosomal protein S18]-alanine N-acetyltransferase
MLALRRWLSGQPPAAGPGAEPSVRAMRPEDRAEVLRIERASFPDPWTAEQLERCLASPHVTGHVLERAGACVGFFLVAHERHRLHLVSLAVAPSARRTGVATRALRSLEALARTHGRTRIELEVQETNLAAQLLYRANGYRAVEIVRAYYGDQDAYRMTKAVRPLVLKPAGKPRLAPRGQPHR